jgi:hypothetical protein
MEQIPTDVFACIIAYLLVEDLCRLARVSKAYHTAVQPLLWTLIEMDRSDFHMKTTHKALGVEEATGRMIPPYNTGWPVKDQHYIDNRARSRGEQFLKTFSGDQARGTVLREGRKKEPGALVRFLCLPTSTMAPSTLTRTFAHFVNLEHLEISGSWEPNSDMEVFEAPLPGLDRPVGSSACYLRVNSPPPENQRPEHIEGMTEDELAKAKEHEDLEHEWVAPCALACLTPEIMSRLVSLKRLYLCKPSNGSTIDYDELYFSTPPDERILEEWSALLRVTRKTLQHLILDQRAVAPEDVGDGTDNRSYMRQCANGPSYDRFVKMVPPALLESKDCSRQ